MAYTQHTEKLLNPDWIVRVTEEQVTTVRLGVVSHPDPNIPTEVMVIEPNKDADITAIAAWAGARTSRKNIAFEENFKEITPNLRKHPEKAAESIANIFEGYGHASVADMAPIFLSFNNLPLWQAYFIFYSMHLGAGQETSTRFVDFNDLEIESLDFIFPPELELDELDPEKREELNAKWESLQQHMKEYYYKWKDKAEQQYREMFEQEDPNIPNSTYTARSLDIARQWIPLGTKTSMCLNMSARDWVEMIKVLRESNDTRNRVLGEQILQVLQLSQGEAAKDFKMQLGSFLKHHQPTYTIPANIDELNRYILEDEALWNKFVECEIPFEEVVQDTKVDFHKVDQITGLVSQYILEIFPRLDVKKLLKVVRSLPDYELNALVSIITHNHNDHDQLRNAGDNRGDGFWEIKTAVSYLRDLNRHRAFGRYIIGFFSDTNAFSILSGGFIKNMQIFNTKAFKHLQKEWKEDGENLYAEINDLAMYMEEAFPGNDASWLRRILPLGHVVRMLFSGGINQLIYLVSLRRKFGGDYGYINIVQRMLDITRKWRGCRDILIDDPEIEGLSSRKPADVRLDPDSISHFKDRK